MAQNLGVSQGYVLHQREPLYRRLGNNLRNYLRSVYDRRVGAAFLLGAFLATTATVGVTSFVSNRLRDREPTLSVPIKVDINNDGKEDFVIGNQEGGRFAFINLGDGSYLRVPLTEDAVKYFFDTPRKPYLH